MSVQAIDIESGRVESCSASEAVSISVMGHANEPEAEMRWLRACVADCLDPVRHLLDAHHLTFEQELAIYNAIPVGATAADIPKDSLLQLIHEVTA